MLKLISVPPIFDSHQFPLSSSQSRNPTLISITKLRRKWTRVKMKAKIADNLNLTGRRTRQYIPPRNVST